MPQESDAPRPAPFPPWSNSIYWFAIGVIAVALAGAPFVFMLLARTPYATGQNTPIVQPVKFDHRHHVLDDGIGCRYCHTGISTSAYAGVPATSICMNCHAQVWPASPELRPVRDSYFEGKPIQWKRVNNVPDFVFFNHAIHVNKGVGCVTCHGRVDRMAEVYQVQPLTMGWCLGCHRNPLPNIRPPEYVTDMDWTPKGSQLEDRRQLLARLDVHPSTDCTACHR